MSLLTGENILEGSMVPERVFQELLTTGFTALNTDPGVIDDLLFKLDASQKKDIRDYLTNHKVAVRLNFPRDNIKFPIVAIVNSTEEESQTFLDDYMGGGVNISTLEDRQIVGHGVRSNFEIYCIDKKDSNAVLWLYYLAKAIFFLNRDFLFRHGLHNVVISGRDVAIREDLFPELVYGRILGVSCDNFFALAVTERVARTLVMRIFTEDPITGIQTEVGAEV